MTGTRTLAIAMAGLLMSALAHAAAEAVPPEQDIQAPRGEDVQGPRGQDVQAPRGQDVRG
jgi:hypothetical protein